MASMMQDLKNAVQGFQRASQGLAAMRKQNREQDWTLGVKLAVRWGDKPRDFALARPGCYEFKTKRLHDLALKVRALIEEEIYTRDFKGFAEGLLMTLALLMEEDSPS
jgi:hypothetical protein